MSSEPKQLTYDEIAVGARAAFAIEMTAKLIEGFAEISGDANPLHVDPEYALTTEFGRPVAHGMIAGALFSRLVGMEMPGKYSLYLSQKINFHHPIFSGQKVVVSGEVLQKTDALKVVIIRTTIRHEAGGELLVDGEALVRILR
jgi:3-hydroxybutyryl-CoA dehydratase